MTSVDPHDPWCLRWIKREERIGGLLAVEAVQALAAALGTERVPAQGEALPPGWQWLFFNPVVARHLLGEDGHPRRTPNSFLPPLELPRRMWAGSHVHYMAPLPIGAHAVRTSRILRITPKEGRSGRMCFVTVSHRIAIDGRDCIVEEQDIVYREALAGAAPAAPTAHGSPQAEAAWQHTVHPDAVMLFRYSALTFNGHRIHYDQPYARAVEGYRDLVVQGPLTATLLQGFASELRPGRRMTHFDFKGLAPLFVDQPLVLNADPHADDTLQLRASTPDGSLAMAAVASFETQA